MLDRHRLQLIDGHGTIAYSRLLSPVGNTDRLEHDEAYGRPELYPYYTNIY